MHHSNEISAGAHEARVEDYLALLKPRVMSLVVFTALVGLLLAPGGINPVIGFIAILSIAIAGGASGALNMWYDSDIDAIMSRTANRPIPAGRMERDHALAFGLVLSVFSVCLLGLATNWVAGPAGPAALLEFSDPPSRCRYAAAVRTGGMAVGRSASTRAWSHHHPTGWPGPDASYGQPRTGCRGTAPDRRR